MNKLGFGEGASKALKTAQMTSSVDLGIEAARRVSAGAKTDFNSSGEGNAFSMKGACRALKANAKDAYKESDHGEK